MNAVGFKSFLRQLLPLIPNTTSISAMQKLLRSVTATIIAIPILVIIVASSHWWSSTIVTATVVSKQINTWPRGRGGRSGRDNLIHTILVSVPGETSMRLQVTPSFYERVKKGQHLKISLRETPLAYVYSGFYQLDSAIIYE